MKKLLAIFCLIALVAFVEEGEGKRSKIQTEVSGDKGNGNSHELNAKKGWRTLFDGKTKNGWHIYRGEGTGSSWQVEDGMLVFVPDNTKGVKNGGDLTTDEEFENYHFSVEWKISEGGNSGIIFNVNED